MASRARSTLKDEALLDAEEAAPSPFARMSTEPSLDRVVDDVLHHREEVLVGSDRYWPEAILEQVTRNNIWNGLPVAKAVQLLIPTLISPRT